MGLFSSLNNALPDVKYVAVCRYCGKRGMTTTSKYGAPAIHPPSPQRGCPSSRDGWHRFQWKKA